MKKVYIKKIDIGSVAKPLFLITVLIALVIGLGLSLFMIPTQTTETFSTNGVIVSEVTNRIPGAWSSVFGMLAAIFINMMGIYITIIVGIFLFNVFCRYTGGVGIEIDVPEE